MSKFTLFAALILVVSQTSMAFELNAKKFDGFVKGSEITACHLSIQEVDSKVVIHVTSAPGEKLDLSFEIPAAYVPFQPDFKVKPGKTFRFPFPLSLMLSKQDVPQGQFVSYRPGTILISDEEYTNFPTTRSERKSIELEASADLTQVSKIQVESSTNLLTKDDTHAFVNCEF